jgi:hypothetical protein
MRLRGTKQNNQLLISFYTRNFLINFIRFIHIIMVANDDSESIKKLLSKTVFGLISS